MARRLVRRGIRTRRQLRAVAGELPRETQADLRFAIVREIPYAVAKKITDEIRRRVTYVDPATDRRRRFPTTAVGSVRRRAPVSKDMDMLAVVPDARHIPGLLASAELGPGRGGADSLEIADSYASGERRRSFVLRRRAPGGRPKYYTVDLFLATLREKPYALFHYSNGRQYNIRVRAHAKRQGFTLNQYGVFCAGTPRRAPGSAGIRTERDLAGFLGVTYRAPAQRTSA